MSIDLAKLRTLQRQAGRVETSVAPTLGETANLPEPLFFKEGRPAVASPSDTSVGKLAEPSVSASTDDSTPLFEKEGPGEIGSAPDPTPIFSSDGLQPSHPSSKKPDLDALRRLIAVRERKPTGSANIANTATAATPTAATSAISPTQHPARATRSNRTLPGEEIAPGLHLIQTRLPLPTPAEALSLAFAKRPDDALDPRRMLFFDTETTGLAGGTGTRAFMIGAADWHHDPQHGDGLRIRQLMISTLSAEPAMLRAFAQWIAPDAVLSSYNGRCYDT
ncbi:MAG: ribonuclease H-like domain-containing protein, partial [Lysobacter sp.]